MPEVILAYARLLVKSGKTVIFTLVLEELQRVSMSVTCYLVVSSSAEF